MMATFYKDGASAPPLILPQTRVMLRVYLSFQLRNGWHCQFLEEDLKASLPRKLHFYAGDCSFHHRRCSAGTR